MGLSSSSRSGGARPSSNLVDTSTRAIMSGSTFHCSQRDALLLREDSVTGLVVFLAAVVISAVPTGQDVPAADDLLERIGSLRTEARYSEAVNLCMELLSLRRSAPDVRPDEIASAEWLLKTLDSAAALPDGAQRELARADSLDGPLNEMARSGEPAPNAVELAEWQLETRLRHLGESHPDVAASYAYLAIMLNLNGETERPEQLFQAQLRIVRGVFGDEHPRVITGHSDLARLAVKQKDSARAELHYREALSIARAVFGDEHDEVAVLLHSLARVLASQGSFCEAEPFLEETVSIYRSLHGDEHEKVVEALRTLGMVNLMMGNHATSAAHMGEALELARSVYGDTTAVVADILHDLATIHFMRDDYESMEAFHGQELAVRHGLRGTEGSDVPVTRLENSVIFHLHGGKFAAAESLMREVLGIKRREYDGDHAEVAKSLSSLGVILGAEGDYAAAEPLLIEALEMRRSLYGEEDGSVASSLGDLGDLYHAKGDYESAETCYRKALAIARAVKGEGSPEVIDYLGSVGSVLHSLGRSNEAESILNQALALAADDPDAKIALSEARISLAYVYLERGDYDLAENTLQDVLSTLQASYGEDHWGTAPVLLSLAQLRYIRGAYGEIGPLLSEAAGVFDSARLRIEPGLKRSTFTRSPYPYLAAAELARGRPEDAWPALELGQARALAELLAENARDKWDDSERGLADSLLAVIGELEGRVTAYEEAARRDSSDDALRRVEETRAALLSVEADWSTLRLELDEAYQVAGHERPSLESVQARLSDTAAIIGWLDIEPKDGEYWSWGYVIRSTGPVMWAGIDSAFVASPGLSAYDQVRSIRACLASRDASGLGLVREARNLWSARVKPLSEALDGVEELIVVPSGPMLGVPMEALVDERGVHLGDRYAISYAPSAAVYAWLAERERRGPGRGSLLVGDPPFNESHLLEFVDGGPAAASGNEGTPTSLLRRVLAGNEESISALPRLRGTRDEIEAVAGVLTESCVLLGPDAAEQEFVRLADSGKIAEFGTIHIATHALVDGERPERSALVLSQLDLPDAVEAAREGTRIYDGLLTTAEIRREWMLDADLVTLSACETGLGMEVAGEGYIGFARTFLEVGARSLLVSLWKVDDAATSLLMRRFYVNWLGGRAGDRTGRVVEPMPKAEALREAKHWLREYTDGSGGRPYEHPYYWSAFILLGDPE